MTASMQRTRPPFRADEVGSLLRSAPIKDARARREQGGITAAQLREVEDSEIAKIIKKQEEVGLQLATDGEYRRSWWHLDFFWGLTGCEKLKLDHGIKFHGVETKPESVHVVGKLDFPADHPMLEHFRFLEAHTRVTPKMCIPAPPVLHFRIPKFDDTVWAYLCSPDEMKAARERMPWVDDLPKIYQGVINAALAGKPVDMTITTHVCRGNFRSTWVSEGGYEPVAERLLAGLSYDGYFLEYDSDRAGGFEPLRFLPKGDKAVVLGLVTSKSGTLESKDAIKRRLDEATKYIDLAQCCLSPQCGFASTEEGNILAEEQQWAKLRMIVELAQEVWG
jgi:5-methyltetrahydropteroyltriglutamate--homocysteine methyltransferase